MIGLASGLEIHHLPRGIARRRTTADRVPTALRRCCGRVDRRVENGIWARHSFLARCVARAYSMPSAGTADAIPQVAARTAVSPLPRDWLWATATAQSRGRGGGGRTSGSRHRQGDRRKSAPDLRPVPKAGTICTEKKSPDTLSVTERDSFRGEGLFNLFRGQRIREGQIVALQQGLPYQVI